jgi:hypothetical protein
MDLQLGSPVSPSARNVMDEQHVGQELRNNAFANLRQGGIACDKAGAAEIIDASESQQVRDGGHADMRMLQLAVIT